MGRAGLTVARVVAAAVDLADEVGIGGVTVSAVARRFGVRDASLYSHIRSAQDLRERVAVVALTELGDAVAEALAGRSGSAALVAFANAYRDYARAHPGRYAATQLHIEPGTPAADAAARHAHLTAALLRDYRLPEPAHTDAIRLLHATFHGYVTLETGDAFHHPRPVDRSWQQVLAALDVALRHWPDELLPIPEQV